MVFPKKCPCTASFFVISGKMVFLLFRNNDIFYLGGKRKEMIFSKKALEIWCFLYICVGVTAMTLPSWKKKLRCPCHEKKNISDISGIIEKDDIHPKTYGISAEISH